MNAFDEEPARSMPALVAAAVALCVMAAGTLWLLAGGGVELRAVGTAAHGGPEAVRGHRYDVHPDGSLAACEVALSIRDVAIVRRAVFAAGGTLDRAASGLFRAGARERDLTAAELADLRTVGERGPAQHGLEYPASLTAER